MKRKSLLLIIFNILIFFPLLFLSTSCTSSDIYYKSEPQKYKHYRSKQPQWNTTRLSNTKYVIHSKRRTKFHY